LGLGTRYLSRASASRRSASVELLALEHGIEDPEVRRRISSRAGDPRSSMAVHLRPLRPRSARGLL